MRKIVFKFYGSGLGDHIQYSTLPELFYQKNAEFYLSNEVEYRNEEVLDLVWRKNPYFCGFTDDYPTIDFNQSDEYVYKYNIQSIEKQNNLIVSTGYPKIYYEPLIKDDFFGKTIIDLNTITCQYEVKNLIKKVKEIIVLNKIEKKDIIFMEFEYENWEILGKQEVKNYVDEIEEFQNMQRYRVKSIYEYCDIIFSCENVISVYSGGASLACAVKNAGTSPNIHVIANEKYEQTSNHKYMNANYYYIYNFNEKKEVDIKEKLKEKSKLMSLPSSFRKELYKQVVILNLEHEDYNFCLPDEIVKKTKLEKIRLGVLKEIVPERIYKEKREEVSIEKKINRLKLRIKKMEPSNFGKTVFFGPWVGEFGIELFGWQGYMRKKSKGYDKVIVCSRSGHEELYKDFCNEFIPHYYQEQESMLGIGENQLKIFDIDIDKNKFDIMKPFTIGYEEYIKEHGTIDEHNMFFDQEFVKYGKYDICNKYDLLIHPRLKKNLTIKNVLEKEWDKVVKHFKKKGLKIACIGSESATYFIKEVDDFRDVSLNKLSNIMASSTMLISVDSGPVHFAALCGCPRLTWAVNIKEQIETHWNPFNTPYKILGKIGEEGRKQKITSKEIISGIEDFMIELKGK